MRRGDPALALVACAIVLAVTAVAPPAHAYCRTSSCDLHPGTPWKVCTPPEPGDCGTPLFWAKPCVGWSLQKDASTQVTFSQAEETVTAAFATWMSAPCPGGGTPRINLTEAEPAECPRHEYNPAAGNANIIMFRDTGWPYAANVYALTTVTYAVATGEIFDADMEIDSTDNQFTTGDTGVVVDLSSIVTHEMGHFLGLDHSPNADATMFRSYDSGTTTLRDLSDDDIAGICAIYPPGDIPSDCDPTPRHGFSALCRADQPRVSCGTIPDPMLDCEITDAKDSFLRRRRTNTNEGANVLLAIGNRGQSRVAVAFDLSTINTSAVRSARLVLSIRRNQHGWGPSGSDLAVYALLQDFAEGNGHLLRDGSPSRGSGPGATYGCASDSAIQNSVVDCNPTRNGGTFGPVPSDTALVTNATAGTVVFDVTADVNAGRSGWLVKTPDGQRGGKLFLYSREGAAALADPSLAPRLELDY